MMRARYNKLRVFLVIFTVFVGLLQQRHDLWFLWWITNDNDNDNDDYSSNNGGIISGSFSSSNTTTTTKHSTSSSLGGAMMNVTTTMTMTTDPMMEKNGGASTTTVTTDTTTTTATTITDTADTETLKIYVYPDPSTFYGFDIVTGKPKRISNEEFYDTMDEYFAKHLSNYSNNVVGKFYKKSYFQLEYELLRGMYLRGHIVRDPSTANVFWIQHSLILNWVEQTQLNYQATKQRKRQNNKNPNTTTSHIPILKDTEGLTRYYNKRLNPLLHYIYYEQPYFNNTTNRQHVFVYTMDNGPTCEIGYGSEVFTSTNNNNGDSKDKDSTATTNLLQQYMIPSSNFRVVGYHGKYNFYKKKDKKDKDVILCFDPSKDITLPQYHDDTWDLTTTISTTVTSSTRMSTTGGEDDDGDNVDDQQQQQQIPEEESLSLSSLEQAITECTGIVGFKLHHAHDEEEEEEDDDDSGGGLATTTTNSSSSKSKFKSKSKYSCDIWYEYLHQRAMSTYKPFYFRGQFNVRGHYCSLGIRQWVRNYCMSSTSTSSTTNNTTRYYYPNTTTNTNVHDTGVGSYEYCYLFDNKNYHDNPQIIMSHAIFALCPAGWGCWSSRMYDSLYNHVTIPIVLADDILLPFTSNKKKSKSRPKKLLLDWENMVIRVTTGNPVNLTTTNPSPIEFQYLVSLANDWIVTCRRHRRRGRGGSSSNSSSNNSNNHNNNVDPDFLDDDFDDKNKCLNHPISKKLAHILLNRKWLGWKMTTNTNKERTKEKPASSSDTSKKMKQGGGHDDVVVVDENAFVLFEQELLNYIKRNKEEEQ